MLEKKLLDEKRRRLQEEAMLTENTTIIDNPHLQFKDMLNGRWPAPSVMAI